MEKEYNKWLIIAGVILIFQYYFLYLVGAFSPRSLLIGISLLIVLIGLILGAFGIINYTKWNIWIKILLTPVLAFVIFVILFWITAAIEQVISGKAILLP